jgi:hypothetical protein
MPENLYYQEVNNIYFDEIKNETISYLYANTTQDIGQIRLDLVASRMITINYQSNNVKNIEILIKNYEKFLTEKFNNLRNELLIGKLKFLEKSKFDGFYELITDNPEFKISFECNLNKKNLENKILKNNNRYFLFAYLSTIFLIFYLIYKKLFS